MTKMRHWIDNQMSYLILPALSGVTAVSNFELAFFSGALNELEDHQNASWVICFSK